MTHDDFAAAIKPKVAGSWNLHSLLPSGMDFFVCLASLSGMAGLQGQSNYASGNTYQDALARTRVLHGEETVSLDLCNLLDIGYVARQKGLVEKVTKMGYNSLEEVEFHALLDYYCDPNLDLTVTSCQVVIGIQSPAMLRAQNIDVPPWLGRPLFRALHMRKSNQITPLENHNAVDYKSLLGAAVTIAEVSSIIVDGLSTKLAKTLEVDKANIEPGRPIHSYGVDSLSAVELRTWFRNQISADISVFDILGNSSISELSALVATKSQYIPPSLKTEVEAEG
jgi:aryl carrier-like protein